MSLKSSAAPPVIDLEAADCVACIKTACEQWGCFIAVNHGIDPVLLEECLCVGHKFFDLPETTKLKYDLRKFGAAWRGYMPRGGESSLRGTQLDAKEGLYLGADHDVSSSRVRAGLPTFGVNVLPDKELPEMRGIIMKALGAMKDLGDRTMDLLSLALGLPEKYLQEKVTEGDPVILPRMFRYPVVLDEFVAEEEQQEDNNNDPIESQWGIGSHSDYGLWTMIVSDAPGLQFYYEDGETAAWVDLPLVDGGIYMNVGDVLDRLTAGRFKSAYHRARNLSSEKPRLSLPFFYDPAWDARMQTLPIPQVGVLLPHKDVPFTGFNKVRREKIVARWASTKIRCGFDGHVQYSQFLAKKVAKVFPDIVPASLWRNFESTTEPSTRHRLVVEVPEKRRTSRLLEGIEVMRQKVLKHPLYGKMRCAANTRGEARDSARLDLVRLFMCHHVWAVWDYFQLLKRLQRELTCVTLPWVPVGDAQLRRFVNEIVLEEETDKFEDGITYGSHLELYLRGMDQVGGAAAEGAEAMRRFLSRLEQQREHQWTTEEIVKIAEEEGAPTAAVAHIKQTCATALGKHSAAQVAAVFAFGREDVIPNMFVQLLPEEDATSFEARTSIFRYYLERHIELDGKDHGPLAIRLVEQMHAQDDGKWEASQEAVNTALQRRYDLWAAVARGHISAVENC